MCLIIMHEERMISDCFCKKISNQVNWKKSWSVPDEHRLALLAFCNSFSWLLYFSWSWPSSMNQKEKIKTSRYSPFNLLQLQDLVKTKFDLGVWVRALVESLCCFLVWEIYLRVQKGDTTQSGKTGLRAPCWTAMKTHVRSFPVLVL